MTDRLGARQVVACQSTLSDLRRRRVPGKRTVQTHLAHLFEKTGSRRQADLVKLIAGYDTPVRGRDRK